MATTASSLRLPDVSLHHEVRGSGPLVALVGAPMDARSFADLADRLAPDHTVLTLDPRGINRSVLKGQASSMPEERADDLARLLRHLDAGPATVLGSSGGAVTSLALVQAHPELVTTVVAHEPPLLELLPDREDQRRQTEEILATYAAGDIVGAWRRFFTQSGLQMPEEMPEDMFGGTPHPQDLADERFWFTFEMPASVRWVPDLAGLRQSGVRVVAGIGQETLGQLCERTTTALAEAIGAEVVRFPGDHTGFVDHPVEFADRLRKVLSPAGQRPA